MEMNFKEQRKSLGHSIAALAKETGVSESTIKNIENEKTIPRKTTFELFANGLKVTTKYEEYYKYLCEKKKRLEKENTNFDHNLGDKLSKVRDFYMEGKYEYIFEILKEFIPIEEIQNYFNKEVQDERKVGKFNTN